MLVFLIHPIKGYAHREGEVINLPDALAAESIKNGRALPYQEETPVQEKKETSAPVKKVTKK